MLSQTYLEVFIHLSQVSAQISAQLSSKKYDVSGWVRVQVGLGSGSGSAKIKDLPLANQYKYK